MLGRGKEKVIISGLSRMEAGDRVGGLHQKEKRPGRTGSGVQLVEKGDSDGKLS